MYTWEFFIYQSITGNKFAHTINTYQFVSASSKNNINKNKNKTIWQEAKLLKWSFVEFTQNIKQTADFWI